MASGQGERCHASRSQHLVDILAREGCSSGEEGELGGVAASSVLPVLDRRGRRLTVPFAPGFKYEALPWLNYIYLLCVGTARLS